MKPPLLTWMSAIMALAGLSGCVSRGGLAALQTELRQREDRISTLDRELEESRKQLEIAKREKESLRSQLSKNVGDKLLPEQSDLIFRAEGLKFSEYLTSGVDRDGAPGDELVSVLLTPHDAAGDPLRLPGELKIEIRDLSNPEGSQLLGSWTWNEQKIVDQWHNGFLASGYHLEIPLKSPPNHSDITLHAQLSTPDGRRFSATQPISLRLPDGTENVAKSEPNRSGNRRVDSRLERTSRKLPSKPLESTSVEDGDRTQTNGARLESRIDLDESISDPFDEPQEESSPIAPKRANPKDANSKSNDRVTETSDRFRSFDPPRFQ